MNCHWTLEDYYIKKDNGLERIKMCKFVSALNYNRTDVVLTLKIGSIMDSFKSCGSTIPIHQFISNTQVALQQRRDSPELGEVILKVRLWQAL